MKNRGLLLFVGLLMTLVVTVQSQCTEDKYEPNNSIVQATPNINLGTFEICVVGTTNGDWFGPYNARVGQIVTVRIDFNPAEGNLDLILAGFDSSTLNSSQTTRPFEEASFTGTPDRSQFWASVILRSDAAGPGAAYNYSVRYGPTTSCSDDPYEPNDNIQQATRSPTTANACQGNPDFFGPITVNPGESLSATVVPSNTQDLLNFVALTSSNMTLATGTQVVGASDLSITSDIVQDVYLAVLYLSSANGASGIVYSVMWNISAPVCTDADFLEPNSIPQLAADLPGASVLVACLDSPDYFGNLNLTQNSNVSIQILFSSPDKMDIQLTNNTVPLAATTHSVTSTSVTVTYTNSQPGVVRLGAAVIVSSNPSRLGVPYTILSKVSLSCTGVQCPPDQLCRNGTCFDPCASVVCPSGQQCSPATASCVCSNGGTIDASGNCTVNLCSGVRCPSGEHCSPNNGSCVCDAGARNSTGQCDLCVGVNCPQREMCVQGTCQCNPGLVRNSTGVCAGVCENVHCGPNMGCQNGTCLCNPGFVPSTNPSNGCDPLDNCSGVICPANSSCSNGFCVCAVGFENGSGGSVVNTSGTCRSIPCFNINCPQHSTCNQDQCFCDQGYYNPQEGGPSVPQSGTCVQDKCALLVCPANSKCQDGTCRCNTGYIQNSIGNCILDPCASVTCSDPHATCFNGVCLCAPGYEQQGNTCFLLPPDACYPTICASIGGLCNATTGSCYCDSNLVVSPSTGMCDYPSPNLCEFVDCPSNSYCSEGFCFCVAGYMERMGQCLPANLGGCSEYRGFADEVTVDLVNQVSLQNVLPALDSLEQNLQHVLQTLPEWEQNECCPSTPWVYPFDMVNIAEASWSFLVDPECSLDRYNGASQQYLQDLKY